MVIKLRSVGHRIIDPVPSVTFKIKDKKLCELQGLSVLMGVWLSGQKKQSQIGPLLITHWGIVEKVLLNYQHGRQESFYGALSGKNWCELAS